jgi:DNA invertase Pin-like site-specific DNA recombinase
MMDRFQYPIWLHHLILLAILIVALLTPFPVNNTTNDDILTSLLVAYALENPTPIILASKRSKRRVALYIRVSTDRQAEEGHSPASQLSDMKAYCRRRNWEVVAVYRDEGLSGRLSSRPGLQQMLADARGGKFDIVVVYYISRLYRKLESLLSTMKLLRDCDVSFVSINEDLDFTSKWGKLILNILGTLAEIYVDELSETTSRGKEQRAREGLYNGSIPFGYCNGLCMNCTDPNGPGYCPLVGRPPLGDGQIPVPHPIEREGVRLAYEWYALGRYSDADIAYLLNEYSFEFEGRTYHFRPKRKPGDQKRYAASITFCHDTVRDLLRRAFYTGVVEYRGGQGVAEERKKFKNAQAIYPGQHQPLISQDLFDQVQAIRHRRGHRPNRAKNRTHERVYPLSRVLYSWPLRSKMRAVANGSGVRFYRDKANIGKSKLDPGTRSPQSTVLAEPLEDQVIAVLETLVLSDAWRQRILAYLVSAEGGLTDIERQRRHLQARFDHLNTLYLQGAFTTAQYQQKKSELEQEMTTLLCPVDLDNAQVKALLANPVTLWRQATPAELKDLFEAVFQRVYVQGEDIVRLVAYPAFQECLADPHQRVIGPADDLEEVALSLPDMVI